MVKYYIDIFVTRSLVLVFYQMIDTGLMRTRPLCSWNAECGA